MERKTVHAYRWALHELHSILYQVGPNMPGTNRPILDWQE